MSQALANNTGPADLVGILFDKLLFKGGSFKFDIHRRTDTGDVNEAGTVTVSHNTETDTWGIALSSHFDDSGTTFTILASGQVQVTTDDLTGASYSGTLRANDIKKINQ